METDSKFYQGYGHAVCEDYAYSGTLSGNGVKLDIPYAVICDGCSSTVDSDFGARVLALAFRKAIIELPYYDDVAVYNYICFWMQKTIVDTKREFGLDIFPFVATIRGMFVLREKLFMFHFGDGYTIYQDEQNNIKYHATSQFPDNTPYYFVNHIDENEKDRYRNNFKGREISHNGVNLNVDYYLDLNTHFYKSINLSELPVGKHVFTVMSDGIETFSENGKSISTEDAMVDLMDITNYRGKFLERQLNYVLKRHKKKGIEHFDDISFASIYYNKEEE
tara:strand:+ start:7162 stop:7995 length:834 start_codon:yes stop_codon:yes gene_type:complete